MRPPATPPARIRGRTRRLLVGPFLTRAQAAARAGIAPVDVRFRPDLLRMGGRSLQEVYFAFQFGPGGVRRDLGTVVIGLRGVSDDVAIADWLVRPHPALRDDSPLGFLDRGGDPALVLAAARTAGPKAMPVPPDLVAKAAPRPRVRTAAPRWHRRPRPTGIGRPVGSH
jgi:hypothetical protein